MNHDFAYLVKISADSNHNRYYRMTRKDNAFEIEMGRVGAAPVLSKRPMALWDTTITRKLKEGYIDRTSMVNITKSSEAKYREIPDVSVRELFSRLMDDANMSLDESYTVSYQNVTGKMVSRAQDIIYDITIHAEDISYCNQMLLELYSVIPRKMKDVSGMMIMEADMVAPVLKREQDILNVMASKVSQESILSEQGEPETTILDALGLDARICSETENEQTIKHLGQESRHYFQRAFRIKNRQTDQKFESYLKQNHLTKKDIHYYYHGSRNRNYMGILTEGLKLNPKAPINGKMFGYGLYFAPRAKKSINYTDIYGSHYVNGTSRRAFLTVYKVAYGNPKDIYIHDDWMTSIRSPRDISPYDAIFAHGGGSLINDEAIVYEESQATLQYLIELKSN